MSARASLRLLTACRMVTPHRLQLMTLWRHGLLALTNIGTTFRMNKFMRTFSERGAKARLRGAPPEADLPHPSAIAPKGGEPRIRLRAPPATAAHLRDRRHASPPQGTDGSAPMGSGQAGLGQFDTTGGDIPSLPTCFLYLEIFEKSLLPHPIIRIIIYRETGDEFPCRPRPNGATGEKGRR